MTPTLDDPPLTAVSAPSLQPSTALEAHVRHNVRMECLFSAFNGVLLGLAVIAVRDVALIGTGAQRVALTILVAAFPVGAFLGPLWAYLGRRWGMQRLVTTSATVIGMLLLCLTWVESAALFTLILVPCQLLCIAIRMGQASLYGVLYPRELRGRVLGRFVLWTYLAMVLSLLLAGWLLKLRSDAYQVIYPATGACAFLAAFFYSRIRLPERTTPVPPRLGNLAELRKVGCILKNDRPFRLFEIGFFLSGASFLMSTHVVLMLVQRQFGFNAFELILWMTVVPQFLVALGSPWWGQIFDRVGIAACRLLVCIFITAFLLCYFFAFLSGNVWWIYAGSFLQGASIAGAQLTWLLASSYFARDPDDVPTYNTIHFLLNGARGLLLPLMGTILLAWIGIQSVLVAAFVSAAGIPFVLRLRRYDRPNRHATDGPTSAAGGIHGEGDDDSHLSTWRRNGADARLQHRCGPTAEGEARFVGGDPAAHVGGRL